VAAAERWLGTPYAWSGGTPSGPSYGTPPDEGVLGFDCSGLALYSWAQEGVGLPHYSGYQYNSGSHPSMSSLLPGDLLFWSYDGTPSTIHHVAIYIGNNQVIEAPESGDVIKIVPVWYDGLVGATRPGT
jgi:cell wall-associated NlpC family hydrolase